MLPAHQSYSKNQLFSCFFSQKVVSAIVTPNPEKGGWVVGVSRGVSGSPEISLVAVPLEQVNTKFQHENKVVQVPLWAQQSLPHHQSIPNTRSRLFVCINSNKASLSETNTLIHH